MDLTILAVIITTCIFFKNNNIPLKKFIVTHICIYVLVYLFSWVPIKLGINIYYGYGYLIVFITYLLFIYTFSCHYYKKYKNTNKKIVLKDQKENNSADVNFNLNIKNNDYYNQIINEEYYRWQKDNQLILERNSSQKYIYDNYFVVKRDLTLKKRAKLFASLMIIPAIIMMFIFFASRQMNEVLFYVLECTLGTVLIGLLITSCIFKSMFKKTLKYPPDNLISNKDYIDLVEKKIADMNVEQMGLDKLGLDIDQVREIRPIMLNDKALEEYSLTNYDELENELYSSTQYVTLLYFTDEQLYVYKLQFDMCCNIQEEWASEFFYVDICDISESTVNEEIRLSAKKIISYSSVYFGITVTNSKIGFEINGKNKNIQSIQAMRQKIRERKK